MKHLCNNCNTTLPRKQKYCSNACQVEYQHKLYITDWKTGEECGWSGKTKQLSHHIIKYMLNKTECACEECGWNKHHPIDNRPLVEIDHIDGDASNCKEENLRVLCPNCHSMTPTFRARNKKSSRQRN